MNAGEWTSFDEVIAYKWEMAHIRRMNRTQAEADAIYRHAARVRIRFILSRLVRR